MMDVDQQQSDDHFISPSTIRRRRRRLTTHELCCCFTHIGQCHAGSFEAVDGSSPTLEASNHFSHVSQHTSTSSTTSSSIGRTTKWSSSSSWAPTSCTGDGNAFRGVDKLFWPMSAPSVTSVSSGMTAETDEDEEEEETPFTFSLLELRSSFLLLPRPVHSFIGLHCIGQRCFGQNAFSSDGPSVSDCQTFRRSPKMDPSKAQDTWSQ
mmetsp:Transcript_41441/g.56485  ORF Transcript_41441/g.56485 Transcript_41441/m.56485 type:complete len:208 (+) Transcript_41441:148-771(+)